MADRAGALDVAARKTTAGLRPPTAAEISLTPPCSRSPHLRPRLKGPPGIDERSTRPYVLARLLMILLLDPLVDEFENSPRWAEAA
jgi:hypothetical protein